MKVEKKNPNLIKKEHPVQRCLLFNGLGSIINTYIYICTHSYICVNICVCMFIYNHPTNLLLYTYFHSTPVGGAMIIVF